MCVARLSQTAGVQLGQRKDIYDEWLLCGLQYSNNMQKKDASGYGIGAVLAQIQPPPQSADLANSDVQELTRKKRFKILRRKGKKCDWGEEAEGNKNGIEGVENALVAFGRKGT
ncbi:hypothetical protein OUZ56_017670 [Daphnia magna]|uniref:Uncharacterized protein n=1 Tax=Daphnia magna TaxID=35525 RepID=A0ABR0ATK6_9CRUS|nr:hypothetical protein OUZ56_017670 [Daphnia magna]